jgi:hypothetical protein
MLGRLVNVGNRGNTLLQMLLELVVRMMLELVMEKVQPCGMGVLGIGIVLLSYLSINSSSYENRRFSARLLHLYLIGESESRH